MLGVDGYVDAEPLPASQANQTGLVDGPVSDSEVAPVIEHHTC